MLCSSVCGCINVMKQQLFVRERAHSKYRAYLLYIVEEGKKIFPQFIVLQPLYETDFDIVQLINTKNSS